jgi:hypothetical protein
MFNVIIITAAGVLATLLAFTKAPAPVKDCDEKRREKTERK